MYLIITASGRYDRVKTADGKLGVINAKGEIVMPKIDTAAGSYENRILVKGTGALHFFYDLK